MIDGLRRHSRQVVFAMCTASLCMGTALPRALAQDRNQQNGGYENQNQGGQRDWSNNSNYQMGQREGQQDHAKNKQRNHRHKFKNAEDRQAYTAGYQNSWSGQGNGNYNQNGNHNQNTNDNHNTNSNDNHNGNDNHNTNSNGNPHQD